MSIFAVNELEYAVAQFVEAPRYKSKGHGSELRWGHWDFSLP
jgi:hypothetical protein